MANNEQIPTQLKINNLLFPTAVKSFGSVDPMLTTDTKMEEALASGNDNITPDELPQSLTEIYNISNKNRWKNKDKKRNREINDINNSNNNNTNTMSNENTTTSDSIEIDHTLETQPLTSSFTSGIEWLESSNPVTDKTPEGTVRYYGNISL